jgi:hypothetical protein
MMGYNFSQNPVPDKYTFFNTPAPAIVQHHVTGGLTQSVGKIDLTVTYYHAFQNSITGPWISPMGPIPGTSATSKMSENSVTSGFGKSFQNLKFAPYRCNVWAQAGLSSDRSLCEKEKHDAAHVDSRRRHCRNHNGEQTGQCSR